jgi:hypothetical protein
VNDRAAIRGLGELEARALEVLHQSWRAVRSGFDELFGDREAEQADPTACIPEGRECAAERMAALRDIAPVAAGIGADPLERRLAAPLGEHASDARQRHAAAGMQFEARALEILDAQAIFDERLADRQAKRDQTAIGIVKAFEGKTKVMAGFRDEGEAVAGGGLHLCGGRGNRVVCGP